MTTCPDCYARIISQTKHRRSCPLRDNEPIKLGLESLEFWLRRLEGHLAQSYMSIARYAYLGRLTSVRLDAIQEYKQAEEKAEPLPKLLAPLRKYPCERTSLAQLRANIVHAQLRELDMILGSL